MLLITHRQRTGHYGTIIPGQQFDCPDDIEALDLIERGAAHRAEPPKVIYETKPTTYETKPIIYETKVIVPDTESVPTANGGGPRPPFRSVSDLPVPDAQPPAVAPASDPLLPGSDLPESGDADRGRWGRHKKSGSRR